MNRIRVTHRNIFSFRALIPISAAAVMIVFGSRRWVKWVFSSDGDAGESLYQASVYSRTVISLDNFHDGFVRRGLGGTLLFTLVSTIWLAAALAAITFKLGSRSRLSIPIYFALVVTLSPQTFLAWGIDIARTDMLVAGFVAWSVFATLSGYRLCGVILLLVGSLAHETALIFGAPLLFSISFSSYSSGKLTSCHAIAMTIVFLIGLGAIMAGQRLWAAPPSFLAHRMLHSGPDRTDYNTVLSKDIATYVLVTGLRGVRASMCYNFDFDPRYALNAILCLIIAASYSIIVPVKNKLLFLISVILPVLFMLLIATDTGRWLQLAVINAWLLAVAERLQGPGEAAPVSIAAASVGGAALAVLLMMGVTHYDNVNRLTGLISNRLGLPSRAPLEQWMARCDPQWQSVLAAGRTSEVPPVVPADRGVQVD
jgi:hypothetical protein